MRIVGALARWPVMVVVLAAVAPAGAEAVAVAVLTAEEGGEGVRVRDSPNIRRASAPNILRCSGACCCTGAVEEAEAAVPVLLLLLTMVPVLLGKGDTPGAALDMMSAAAGGIARAISTGLPLLLPNPSVAVTKAVLVIIVSVAVAPSR
jgi:hypothetical protein